MDVNIISCPSTRIAVLQHRGSPDLVNATAARFIAWRKTSGLSPVATSDTWGIAWDDPQTTPQEAFRFDICAVVRHHGSLDTLANSVWFLYRDWLPASGETLRDFPVYFRYLNFVHEVAEHELQTDIYLPLA